MEVTGVEAAEQMMDYVMNVDVMSNQFSLDGLYDEA